MITTPGRMMTRTEHYLHAEALLTELDRINRNIDRLCKVGDLQSVTVSYANLQATMTAAQAHATLATAPAEVAHGAYLAAVAAARKAAS